MTTITLPRAVVEQALEALRHVVRQAQENLVPTIHYGPVNDVMNRLEAALAQQAEPVASLNAWAADRLARHGIQACLYPNCVGGQSGTVCHKHCPTPCPDCRGLGYDASGQLCGCQQNPSFG